MLSSATMLASIAWLRGGATSGSDAGGAGGMGSPSPTSLDPADWATLRASAHAVLDASLDKLEAASEGRVWTPVPDDLKEALRAPVPPEDGLAHGELCERLLALLPYGAGNTHPRFFGWVHGSGSPGGVLPELVGAAMNANCGGRDHVGIYVERQVSSDGPTHVCGDAVLRERTRRLVCNAPCALPPAVPGVRVSHWRTDGHELTAWGSLVHGGGGITHTPLSPSPSLSRTDGRADRC